MACVCVCLYGFSSGVQLVVFDQDALHVRSLMRLGSNQIPLGNNK